MILVALASDADAQSLGRLDYTMVSEQTMMEMAFVHVDDFKDKSQNFKDLGEWAGVKRDDAGNVRKIGLRAPSKGRTHYDHLHSVRASGPVNFAWVPPGVQRLELENITVVNFRAQYVPSCMEVLALTSCSIRGSLEASILPRTLWSLDLTINQLSGTLDMQNMPDLMSAIVIAGNDFEDTLQTAAFPQSLRFLNGCYNRFFGPIDLSRVPRTLLHLYLTHNRLTGAIDASQVPETLLDILLSHNLLSGPITLWGSYDLEQDHRVVQIHYNQFQGTITHIAMSKPAHLNCDKNRFTAIDWKKMTSVYHLSARMNRIGGTLCIAAIPKEMQKLDLSENLLVGSIFLQDLHADMTLLLLARNDLSGSIDILDLPPSLEILNLMENRLTGPITFGKHIPVEFSLQGNNFTSIHPRVDKSWDKLRILDVSHNSITQEVLQCGHVYFSDVLYINLFGNAIGRCEDTHGRRTRSRKVFYDAGRPYQRSIEKLDELRKKK